MPVSDPQWPAEADAWRLFCVPQELTGNYISAGTTIWLLSAHHVCPEGDVGVTREGHGQPFQVHLLITVSSDWTGQLGRFGSHCPSGKKGAVARRAEAERERSCWLGQQQKLGKQLCTLGCGAGMVAASWWPRQEQHPCFPETHPRFSPSQSSTYSATGSHFFIQYGTGSLSGVIGVDQVSVSIIPSCSLSWSGTWETEHRSELLGEQFQICAGRDGSKELELASREGGGLAWPEMRPWASLCHVLGPREAVKEGDSCRTQGTWWQGSQLDQRPQGTKETRPGLRLEGRRCPSRGRWWELSY